MTVTRTAGIPQEMVDLFVQFARASKGQRLDVVRNAALNLVVQVINAEAKERGVGIEGALEAADKVAEFMKSEVARNYEFKPDPDAIPVNLGGH